MTTKWDQSWQETAALFATLGIDDRLGSMTIGIGVMEARLDE